MADYINDGGSYDKDATLSGTYTIDEANHTLTMGADGQADSGYTLPPSTAWLLVETYDIDGTAGDLGGHWFQLDVSNVDTDLQAYWDINDALVTATTYTSFKMKATLFNGTSTAKVLEADQTGTGFPDTEASPTYTVTSWTPPTGTWKITDTLVAPTSVVDIWDTWQPAGNVTWGNATGTYTVVGTDGLNFSITGGNENNRPVMYFDFTEAATNGQDYEWQFDLTVNSGTMRIYAYQFRGPDGAWTGHATSYSVTDSYAISMTADSAGTYMYLAMDSSSSGFHCDVEFRNCKFVEV